MNSELSHTFQWLSPIEIPLANKFYKTNGLRRKARGSELCAVIRDGTKQIIACAYVREYQTFKLLVGVAVSSAFQRQGIARRLLNNMTCKLNYDTYTFPYQHLTSLYQSVGFTPIRSEQSLPAVAELCRKYRNQGRNISIMVHGRNSEFE
jgi:N-acetylglutamate synthase-like GNAT family acetyltransferase